MLLLLFIFSLNIIFLVYWFVNKIRYESFRRYILDIITPGNVVFINDMKHIKLIKNVLESSYIKGNGIERQFASYAWKPIYNVESEDNDIWSRLRENVFKILHSLNLEKIRQITMDITNILMNETNGIITSKDISILSARIFFKSLFNMDLSIENYELFYSSSLEWRKEVALKSKGDLSIKNNFFKFITDLLISHGHINMLMLSSERLELISSFIQPFFISPMINFSDIFVSLEKYKDHINFTSNMTRKDCRNIIFECIRLEHPFPILEREITKDILYDNIIYKKGTHFYIELDNLIQDREFNPKMWDNTENPYRILPFGTGPRQCIGKVLAMNILIEILYTMTRHENFDVKNLKFKHDHLYSGRDNDNISNLSEVLYVFRQLCYKIIYRIYNLQI